MKHSATDVENALRDADADVYERYSGKCMYGKACPGFTVDQDSEAFGVFVRLAEDDAELATFLARGARTDSLGRGSIVYFPEVTYTSAELSAKE